MSNIIDDEETLGRWLIEKLRSIYNQEYFYFSSVFNDNECKDPFKILVATILSQNSTDKAAVTAYRGLEKITDITPYSIARLNVRTISSAIRPAGLNKSKSKALKKLSKIIISKYEGDISKLLKNKNIDTRKELMSLPNVGPKTCDVLLLNCGILKTVPVDTHISRIAKRLGLVPYNAGYEVIRRKLDQIFNPNDRQMAHLLLIMHGRKICKAKNPLCKKCIINEKCHYYKYNR